MHEAAKTRVFSKRPRTGSWKETRERSRTRATAAHLLLRLEPPTWVVWMSAEWAGM